MAPPRPNPYENITANQLKNITLLPEYQCRMCKRIKVSTCFSNKETNMYKFKKLNGVPVNATSAKLRCRTCTGEQAHELKCQGQCGTWKPLDAFSKSQRRNGQKWCKECVLWKEAIEPGTVAGAGPGMDIAPDEDSDDESSGEAEDYIADPEGGYSSGEEYSKGYARSESVPYQAFETLSVAASTGTSVAPASTVGTISTSTARSYLPPHLRVLQEATNNMGTSQAGPSNVNGTGSAGSTKISISSASNPYDTQSERSLQPLGGQTSLPYNAYDATGNLHVKQRMVSVGAPSQATPNAQSNPRVDSNWARAAGSRNAGPTYISAPPSTSATRNRHFYDSDESQDEM